MNRKTLLYSPLSAGSRGFTLIEVLVSVVVISVGLLGVAAMQYAGLRDSNRSNERSVATMLAYDIVDRMRINPQAVYAGGYLIDPASAPPAPPVAGGASPQAWCRTDFTGTGFPGSCTSANLATADSYDWYALLTNALVAGNAEITCVDADSGADIWPCSPGSIHSITVMWDELRTGATGVACDASKPTVDLFCLKVNVQL